MSIEQANENTAIKRRCIVFKRAQGRTLIIERRPSEINNAGISQIKKLFNKQEIKK